MDGAEYVYVPRRKRGRGGKRRVKKRRPPWKRWLIRLGAAAAVFLALAYAVLSAVTPVIVATAEAKIKSLSTMAVNNAVFEVMSESIRYSDLITVTKDDGGHIRLISANTQLINRLAQDTARSANRYIADIGEQGIGVALGTLSGIAVLAGRGPDVKIRAVPAGSVVCEFLSEFEEAGINQTRHKIFLEVLSLVVVVLPNRKIDVYNTTQVLVSENIIVGEVPATFLRVGSLGGTAYDLIPK